MRRKEEFVFRRLDTIGDLDAAQDSFLEQCFVDTGTLDVLRDCDDARRLLVGRTGSGKTALLKRLSAQERTIVIEPERLALPYISNTTILKFVADLGVNLDIFFRYLWRHVLSVELLRTHYAIHTDAQKVGVIERIRARFVTPRHARAIGYIERFGKEFWKDTDAQIKDVTTKLADGIEASLKTTSLPIGLGASAHSSLTEEQRTEITHRAREVVNHFQIRELSEMIEFIAEVLDDPQQRYYLLIDGLDENWVDEHVRYSLVRGLIETVRDFRKVRYAKIIVAMRLDLIERVFQKTRDEGFQEEKYDSLYLNLKWSKADLMTVLDSRIDCLVRRRYTGKTVTHRDLLPAVMGKQKTMDYLLARTMMRPRDAILFLNKCIDRATDKPAVSAQMIRDAEGEYSRVRLRSLIDEWGSDYPNMMICVEGLLKNRPQMFALSDITRSEVEDLCLMAAISKVNRQDVITEGIQQVMDGKLNPGDFAKEAVEMFYRIGLVGLKLSTHEATVWSTEGRRTVSSAEIRPDTRIAIHPCFWRVLGVGKGDGGL